MVHALLAVLLFGLLSGSGLIAAVPWQKVDESTNPKADIVFEQDAPTPAEPLTLWYRKPAKKWETEALPVGNGRLAAMVFGGVNNERIQFNEETVWDGVPTDYTNPQALEALPEVQRLLFEGENGKSVAIANKKMLGDPQRVKSYQTLADLLLDFDNAEKVSNYRRDLDLTTAINRTQFTIDGVEYMREVFVSEPDQVIVVHLKANKPESVNFTARLARANATIESTSDNRLVLRGKLGVSYEAQLRPCL